ncbi:MAG: 30S ribosomal protein S20 [bacterium]|nr:30S ribosomal protein S20 [bacterium]
MPIHDSPIKQMRKDKKRNLQNKQAKSTLRTAVKKIYTATTADEKQNNFKVAAKLLDKTAQKQTIHWKNAARKKSRLAIYINKQQKETKAK